jgi:hypothetical protein
MKHTGTVLNKPQKPLIYTLNLLTVHNRCLSYLSSPCSPQAPLPVMNIRPLTPPEYPSVCFPA